MGTYLILGYLESTVNVVFRLPNSGNSMFVISESLLEMTTKLAQYDRVSCLFVDLCP